MQNLNGKVIVLTGASSGIGRATALALAKQGAVLHLIARRGPLLEQVCQQARALGGSATAHVLDIRDPAAFAQMADSVHAEHQCVDVLINNAGVGPMKPFLQTTDDDWKWTFDTNVYAVVTGVRAFLPAMLEHGRGTIINVASLAGLIANPLSAYTASKFAVVGLSESLLIEYGNRGVEFVVVCPGVIDTGIATAAIEAGRSQSGMDTRVREFLAKHGAAPEAVAHDIVQAIHRPRPVVLSPRHAGLLRALHRVFPDQIRALFRRFG